MIITLRTDNPTAEIGVYDTAYAQCSYYSWRADRELAATLLTVLRDQLQKTNADWKNITGIIVYKGPGSFTGLRIGITVANTLAYAQQVPIVGTMGDNWITAGLERLKRGETDQLVLPHYGAEATITMPKK